MSEHSAKVEWTRTTEDFTYDSYDRDHVWTFEGGIRVPASSAPAFLGNAERVDPEKAFVASRSSCHILTFLAYAAKKRFTVDAYTDEAVGYLEKDADGKLAMTRVILRPQVTFSGEKLPSPEQIEKMHHSSHEQCFIASSVKTQVTVEAPSQAS